MKIKLMLLFIAGLISVLPFIGACSKTQPAVTPQPANQTTIPPSINLPQQAPNQQFPDQQAPNQQPPDQQVSNQQPPDQQVANQPEVPFADTKFVEIVFEVEVAQGVDTYNGAFKPPTATIPVGTTVTWFNNDTFFQNTHTVTSRDGFFDASLNFEEYFQYTFNQQGTFEYYCKTTLDGELTTMSGKIVVE